MSNQNQQSFTMKIVPSEKTETGPDAPSCSVAGGNTIDLAAAYRSSRLASQYSLSSMRGLSAGTRSSGSAGYFRRAA